MLWRGCRRRQLNKKYTKNQPHIDKIGAKIDSESIKFDQKVNPSIPAWV
jgi:hypothetical protein